MTSAYAPSYATYDLGYTNRVPLLTTQEYALAPTSMDTSNLVPGGSPANNLIALQETIARASSWIDQYVMGSTGTIAATLNAENARIWSSRDGTLKVHPRFWPILEVDSFTYLPPGVGFDYAASVSPAGSIWIEPQEFTVNVSGNSTFSTNYFPGSGLAACTPYFCSWSYVNGYPVTTAAASIAAGAASIQPVSVIGIYPGTNLTIYDQPYDEQIQVSFAYTPGNATVPLVGTTAFAHNAGVMVTNLPPAIKQAAILATTAFIKQRGSGAMVVSDMGTAMRQSSGFSQNSGSDWWQAEELLLPFRQAFVSY